MQEYITRIIPLGAMPGLTEVSDVLQERTQELFWKYVRETASDERLPVVHLDRYTFFFYEVASLVFCLTTGENPSPSSALEFLKGFTMLLNSILGTLSEEKVRSSA